jgi:hypothetical protein
MRLEEQGPIKSAGTEKTRHRWRDAKRPCRCLSFLSVFLRLLLLALLLCGQSPFPVFGFNQNVIRVFKLLFPCPTQPVIVQGIVHETLVKDVQQPQAGFRLQSSEYVSPGKQGFFGEKIELLQVCKIASVLLESAIQVCNGSIGA